MTAIVAHQRRWVQAERLRNDLGARVFVDDGFLGEWKNTRRALEWARQQPHATHALILQDDAVPIDNFTCHLHEAIRRRREHVLGLYIGTGRPWAPQVLEAVQAARCKGASWIMCEGLIWGVASVWPIPLISDFLQWSEIWRHRLPFDQRALAWSQATGRLCYYPWPSLVNHADGPSVIKGRNHKLELVRVAHEVGVPDWNDVEVPMLLAGTLRP